MDTNLLNLENIPNFNVSENGSVKEHKIPIITHIPVVVSSEIQSFGSEQSAKVAGNPMVLKTHFEWFFQDAMRNATGRNTEQQKKIDDLKKEITGLESNNIKLSNDIEETENIINNIEKSIAGLRAEEYVEVQVKKTLINNKQVEIDKIKNGDYTVLGTEVKPGDRIGYYIGLAIWGFLTLYLIIFYTSVIYSAFILDATNITTNITQLTNTIVNLQAIPRTHAEHGVFGVLFLLFATFMFIALGYLIHKFNQNKEIFKSIFVYTFTLAFDAVLSYTIVKNLHQANVLTAKIPNVLWEASIAFTSMDFYVILMAGFAAYIIWGFILEYMISEYDNTVPARVGLKTRETEILQLEQQILDIKDKFSDFIGQMLQKLDVKKTEKNDLRVKIDNNTTAVDIKKTDITTLERSVRISIGDLKTKISQFLIGWCGQIKMTLPPEESKSLISNCHIVLDDFYKTIKID
jgi:hypothetical protein